VRAILWVIIVSSALALSLPAQERPDTSAPKRPALAAGADTNDAVAYFALGVSKLDSDPETAASAFYWSMRIDPELAEAFYARRIALLLADPGRLVDYMERSPKVMQSPEIRQIDSLEIRALALNPFLYRKFDRELLLAFAGARGGAAGVGAADMNIYVLQRVENGSMTMSGWVAYCEGRLPEALAAYAEVIRKTKRGDASALHAERGRIFFMLHNYDSALAELKTAIGEMRQREAKRLVVLYHPKAMLEQSIGLIEESRGNREAAREAYGRALSENLAYYPAHVRLSALSFAAGDTAAALSEIALAVQLAENDPTLHYRYGYTLVLAGQYADAETELRAAIALDPDYAAPYQILGRILDSRDDLSGAITEYEAFLARAAHNDRQYRWTRERIAFLRSKLTEAPGVQL
jgi:hypothetical protein